MIEVCSLVTSMSGRSTCSRMVVIFEGRKLSEMVVVVEGGAA